MLARIFESAGLSTVLVTNMPYWPRKAGAPRTLAVEFPFGQLLGQPNNVYMQLRVIKAALSVLQQAEEPGTIVHYQEKWPQSLAQALEDCHPAEPPPIMDQMGRHMLSFFKALRRSQKKEVVS